MYHNIISLEREREERYSEKNGCLKKATIILCPTWSDLGSERKYPEWEKDAKGRNKQEDREIKKSSHKPLDNGIWFLYVLSFRFSMAFLFLSVLSLFCFLFFFSFFIYLRSSIRMKYTLFWDSLIWQRFKNTTYE